MTVLHNTDSPAGVAATSAPGVVYSVCVYLIGLPVEKWVSGLTAIFVTLQIIFMLADRVKKRGKRAH